MNKYIERIYNGVIRENPVMVMLIGMCPTLAVTTSAINGIGMGLSTTVVLILSNLIISLLRKVIPDGVRIPAFIVVVASLVTVVQFLMQGFLPDLYESLGIYIPLIVVNCIILGRAESYASKNGPVLSIFDGIGMGIGFTWALLMLGLVREILGSGQAFGVQILPLADASTGTIGFTPITIFVLAPGAFFVLAILIAIMNVIRAKAEAKGKPLPEPTGCLAGNCDGCAGCPGGGKGTKVITAGEDLPPIETKKAAAGNGGASAANAAETETGKTPDTTVSGTQA